jgi:hypothetical protein
LWKQSLGCSAKAFITDGAVASAVVAATITIANIKVFVFIVKANKKWIYKSLYGDNHT